RLTARSRAASRDLPRRAAVLLDACRRLGAAGVGDLVHPLAVALGRAHEPLVLEELQGRVDRARARAPGAAGLVLQRLPDVVAVAGPFREDCEQGGADLAAAHPRPSPRAFASPVAAASAVPPLVHGRSFLGCPGLLGPLMMSHERS